MTDNAIHHVQHMSRKFLVLFNVLLVLMPVAVFLYWAFFNQLPDAFHTDLPVAPAQPLSTTQLILGALVSLLPLTVAVYGLVTLKSLFRLYAEAIIFSAENVKYFRRLGYLFIAWVVANAIFTPLISLVLTLASPVGQRAVAVKFGIVDLFALLIGGIVLVVAWVMNEGRKLEDEQAHTV